MELIAIQVLVLVFSVVVHEVAHGWSALKLGDDTALRAGRLTLNPLPHIDPVGSILVPIIMAATMGFPFGWAKPVPVNPGRLNSPNDDHPKVAAAGPASNLLLAFAFSVLLGVIVAMGGYPDGGSHGAPSPMRFIVSLFEMGIVINVILAVFNLLPIPPLDGSWILSRFLPPEARAKFENLRRHGMLIFIGFIMLINYTPVGPGFRGLYMAVIDQYFKLVNTIGGWGS